MIALVRTSTPHLDVMFRIMLSMNNSPSIMKMMVPGEVGAEVEVGEMETEM